MMLKFIPWHTSWRDEHSAWRLVDERKELHAIVGDAPSCPEVRDRLNHIPNMLRYLGSLARNHFYGLITVIIFSFWVVVAPQQEPFGHILESSLLANTLSKQTMGAPSMTEPPRTFLD